MKNRVYEKDSIDYEIENPQRTAPRLLLHACCAPCSSSVIEYIEPYFDITLYFFNPNILPKEEFIRRLDAFKPLLERFPKVKLIVPEQSETQFTSIINGLERLPEGGARCEKCFGLRINNTAEYLSRHKDDFDFYATTLTLSPHKNAPLINSVGMAAAEKYGVEYLSSDFKKRNGYLRSVELCAELGIYRQNYCGCGYPEKVE